MKKKYVEYISSGIMILLALAGWIITATWKAQAISGSNISTKFYPRVVFTGIFICGIIVLIRNIIKSVRGGDEALNEHIDIHIVKVCEVVALTLVYIFALSHLGFIFTTPIFLFLCMLIFGERRWFMMAIISIVGTAVVWLFFVQIMGVRF